MGAATAATSDSTLDLRTTYPGLGTTPRRAAPTAVPSIGTVRPTQLVCRTAWVPSTIPMYSAVAPGPRMLI